MRLDKFLSNMGVGTRTEVKQLLKKNSVKVNDKVEKSPKYQVNPEQDEITVDGKIIEYINQTVIDLIADYRHLDIFPVGRLDKDTEGLLLITNDGQFNHNLMSPSKHVSKTYKVTSKYPIKNEDIIAFKNGIELSDGKVKPAQLEKLDHKLSLVTIYEGKYHQVKRMFHSIDNEVLELKRLKISNLTLDENLKSGEYRLLTSEELKLL